MMAGRLLDDMLALIVRRPALLWLAVVANLLGAVIGGIYWYGPMLLRSPWWSWVFIPDCPLAALLGAIVLLLYRSGRAPQWLIALTAFACIKYGTWTILFWIRQWSGAGAAYPVELLLFITHIGLLAEGVLFSRAITPAQPATGVLVSLFFTASVVVDYGLGFHPPLVSHVSRTDAFAAAALLTALLSIALWRATRRPAR
jgi:uncharacterized membrane protein YpjA